MPSRASPPRTSPSPPSAARPPARLALMYGNREAKINEAKLEFARTLIPNDEERRENVVEIAPSGNNPLTLRQALPQFVAELAQESLFGDTCRVVIVHQLQEFFAAGRAGGGGSAGAKRTASRAKTASAPAKSAKASARKRASASTPPADGSDGEEQPDGAEAGGSGEAAGGVKGGSADPVATLFRGLDDLLKSTPNAALFVAIEDEAKNRRVNEASALFMGLSQRGAVRKFASKAHRFELTDAILSRSLPAAMQVIAEWRKDESRAAASIFRVLSDDVSCLIQAAIYTRESAALRSDPTLEMLLFPGALRPNLLTLHDFRKRNYLNAIRNYPSMEPLLEAMRGLLEIQKALYPVGDELYIPEVDYLIDIWLARLLSQS